MLLLARDNSVGLNWGRNLRREHGVEPIFVPATCPTL